MATSIKNRIRHILKALSTIDWKFDHDELFSDDFWNDFPEIDSCNGEFVIESLRMQLEQQSMAVKAEEAQLKSGELELELRQMENTRLLTYVHDLEEESKQSKKAATHREKELSRLREENERLQKQNSGLWLINAGLRHDLTELILGGEDDNMIGEVARAAEKQEWHDLDLSEDTLVESLISNVGPAFAEEKIVSIEVVEDDLNQADEDAMNQVVEDTAKIINEAQEAIDNLMIGS